MEPRTLNTAALVAMAITGGLWLGFGLSGNLALLLGGAVSWGIGFTAFVAFVVSKIDQYLREGSIGVPVDHPRPG